MTEEWVAQSAGCPVSYVRLLESGYRPEHASEVLARLVAILNALVAATPFTPYRGRGRRVVAHLLEAAATASAAAQRDEWKLPLARDALVNAAPRGLGCWSDAESDPVRRPKLEGEPYLKGARMVVAFGLGECVLCGDACDVSVRKGRHARAALYCSKHVRTSNRLRSWHRDLMHNALEHAALFQGIR